MTTNQGLRQESFRAISGTALTYNGDALAAYAAEGITETNINGAEVAWLQAALNSTESNINGLRAAFAAKYGAASWNELGTFLPTANMVLRYDALDFDSITKSSNLVSIWADKSISEANAFQVIGARQVTYQATGVNDLPALYSNGVLNMGMGFVHPISVGDDYTMFVVFKGDTSTVDPETGSSINAVISGSAVVTDDEYIGIRQTADGVDGSDHNEFRTLGSGQGDTVVFSDADVITMAFDQSFLDTYIGTTLQEHGSATTGSQVITNGHIFRDDTTNRSMVGWIQEVIIYKRFLSAAEILHVQNFLISKWGL